MIANKKNILALLFLCLSSIVSGVNYYVSSTGNDASNGLSESTPWKSITKVNSAFSSFRPGDMILFKRGDIFYGSFKITVSGIAGKPIVLGAYGTGAAPIISGFTTISGWTNYGGGIYSKSVPCAVDPNVVSFNGTNKAMGRWPKTSYYATDDVIGKGEFKASELNSSVTNWTGAEVVVKSIPWVLDRAITTSHSGSTIYNTGVSYGPPNDFKVGNGFFIQKDIKTLTTVSGIAPILGEWYHNHSSNTFYMYFGAANPNNYTVKVPSLGICFDINNKDYITIDGVDFEGFSDFAVLNNTDYFTVQNCNISFIGRDVLEMSGNYYGQTFNNHITLTYCNISNVNNNGITSFKWNRNTYITVTHCNFTDIGIIAGHGSSANGTYEGMLVEGDYGLIQYNRVVNCGYNGIGFYGNYTKVLNNFVDNATILKADGGGIYTVVLSDPQTIGTEVKNNIVMNCLGNIDGLAFPRDRQGYGIYFDDNHSGGIIDGNTIYNCSSLGILLNASQNVTVSNNTILKCGWGNLYEGAGIGIMNYTWGEGTGLTNISMTGNKIISTVNVTEDINKGEFNGQWALITKSPNNDILPANCTFNNNYYAKPLNPSQTLIKTYQNGEGTVSRITLSQWKTMSGEDANTQNSPITIDNVNKIRFEYNETNVNKVISLDAGYIDVTGTKYSGNITLLPYTSLVLLLDPNPAAAPLTPSYVSSAIENTTPAILEMTYNTTLANVAPAASAFSVRVNSVARVVNTVVISGTKVRLSLASPILYGDVVTVAYSKPSSNPLQTVAGGQATNLSAQTVTNRVSSTSIPVVPVNPVYVGSTVENETPNKIEMVFSISLSNVLPTVSAFTVNINSVSRPVSSLAISGSSVILTLGSQVIFGDVITVSYTKPGTNALQSTTGLQVATMSAQTVSNKVSSVGPIYVNASVEKVTPNILEITYNENLDNNTIPTTSAFVVMVNGIQRTVTSVAISSKKVLLTLAIPVVYGDIITVSYIKPATNPLKKSTGEAAGSFSSPQRVTNNIIKKSNIYVFPNPAREYINITVKEPSRDKQIIRIFDFSGKLCLETILDPLANTIRIPVSLNSGVYIVQVIMGSLTSFTQKIIITN